MFDRFLEYVKAEELLCEGDACLAGVSGGSDSICLFLLLIEAARVLDLDLAVVHVNHMIRGDEADRDEIFVKDLCEKYGITCFTKKVDVPAISKKMHISEEEAGRNARKEVMAAFGDEHFARPFKVALAHHRGDNAETVIYRLARGTGMRGLAGIPPKGPFSFDRQDIEVIHPLLPFDKNELCAKLQKRGQSWVEDATNTDVAYDRNRIRRKVIPQLEKLNGGALGHITDTATDVRKCLLYIAKSAKEELLRSLDEHNRLRAKVFLESDEALHGEMFMQWLQICGISSKDYSRKHISGVVELAKTGNNGRISLVGKTECILEYGWLRLDRNKKVQNTPDEQYALEPDLEELKESGHTVVTIPGWRFDFNLKKPGKVSLGGENSFYICLSYDKIINVCVRNWRQGDEIVITKDGNRKSVRRLLIDKKIPASTRKSIPVVACNDKVVWVCGVRQSMDFFVDEHTQDVLEIVAKRDECYE